MTTQKEETRHAHSTRTDLTVAPQSTALPMLVQPDAHHHHDHHHPPARTLSPLRASMIEPCTDELPAELLLELEPPPPPPSSFTAQ